MKNEIKEISKRYNIFEDGTIFYKKTGRERKQTLSRAGYFVIGIYLPSTKKQKAYFVHRLVAIKYIKNPKNKPCVNHKNGLKIDNRKENLEWNFYSENTSHHQRLVKEGAMTK